MGQGDLDRLLDRYLEDRDEAAVVELVRRTRPRLLHVARRIGQPQDAEDSVQAAYLSLMHKRAGAMDAPVLPWLITAVVRIAYGHKARRRKLRDVADRLARVPEPSDVTLAAVFTAERSRAVRRHVDDLPADFRDAVVLHYFQGLKTAEIGALLGVTPDAVKKRLQRARALLRGRIHPRVIGWLMAAPWLLMDRAGAALLAGGVAMKSKAAIAAVVVLVAALTVVWQAGRRATDRSRAETPSAPPPALAVAEANPVAARGEPAPMDTRGYTGRVVTPDGAPASGALVEIRASYRASGGREYVYSTDPVRMVAERHAIAGADGRFRLEPKHTDVVALQVHAVAEGYARTIARLEPDRPKRIVLTPGALLRVTAVDTEGRRLPQSAVWIYDADGRDMILGRSTDDAGTVEIRIAQGSYALQAMAQDHVPSAKTPVRLERGQPFERTITLSRGVVLDVHVLGVDDAPVEGAVMRAQGPRSSRGEARTDRDGRCRIAGIGIPEEGLREGWRSRLYYRVDAPGYARLVGRGELPRTEGDMTLHLRLVRGVPVTVKVTDTGARPVAGVTVSARYEHESSPLGPQAVKTDADGNARFPHMRPGTLEVSVYRPGHAHVRAKSRLEIGREAVETLVTVAGGSRRVEGVVLGPDGRPVAGGKIGFLPHDRGEPHDSTGIDSEGRFVLEVPDGPGRLRVAATGFAAQLRPVGDRVRLDELGAIAGKVVLRDGSAVAGIEVKLQERQGMGWNTEGSVTMSGPDGAFRFRGAGDGAFTLRVWTDEWISSIGLGHGVTAGATDLRLTVKPRAEGQGILLVVRAFDERDGSPLDGPVALRGYTLDGERGRWHLRVERVKSGEYAMRYHDRPGTCDFDFGLPGYLRCTVRGVTIRDLPHHDPIDLHFDRGRVLRLRALTPDGAAPERVLDQRARHRPDRCQRRDRARRFRREHRAREGPCDRRRVHERHPARRRRPGPRGRGPAHVREGVVQAVAPVGRRAREGRVGARGP